MSKAMKYSDFVAKHAKNMPGRKLDEWEISGDYTIQPQECINFMVQTENIYDEDIISYAADGKAIGEKSYVTFNVVDSSSAYYEDGADDSSLLWIAPLGDFMAALSQYKAAYIEDFCEQCERAEDYCGYGDQQRELCIRFALYVCLAWGNERPPPFFCPLNA